MTVWTSELIARAVELDSQGVTSTKMAVQLSAEFGISLTRNSVLGQFHRMKKSGKIERAPRKTNGQAREGVVTGGNPTPAQPVAVARAAAAPKRPIGNQWREQDNQFLRAIELRRDGITYSRISALTGLHIDDIEPRLRAVARDDEAFSDVSEAAEIRAYWRFI